MFDYQDYLPITVEELSFGLHSFICTLLFVIFPLIVWKHIYDDQRDAPDPTARTTTNETNDIEKRLVPVSLPTTRFDHFNGESFSPGYRESLINSSALRSRNDHSARTFNYARWRWDDETDENNDQAV